MIPCNTLGLFKHKNGGENGIRTHGGLMPSAVFETAAFGHSAISPSYIIMYLICHKMTIWQINRLEILLL